MKNIMKWIVLLILIIVPLTWLILNIKDIKENMNETFTTQNQDADQGESEGSFSKFFDGSRETENFGEYKFSEFDGKHYGIDYHLPEDTPIKAAADGKVTRTFDDDLGGKVIQIAESNGEYHQWYMHLNEFKVEVGDDVKAGDTIALSGNTGEQTTGAHLHFQRMEGGVGNDYAIDPKDYVEDLPNGEESLFEVE
ncbi:M23 family metallopeptidase [Staphylococcus saprophyticus]|nr:M23 family metallopeptidase [Staphylococcus saprophyticus]MBN6091627.1 M23 family metallopeptidase [Staphylococcus saprophyticus]